jgi:hypothetical protein
MNIPPINSDEWKNALVSSDDGEKCAKEKVINITQKR